MAPQREKTRTQDEMGGLEYSEGLSQHPWGVVWTEVRVNPRAWAWLI